MAWNAQNTEELKVLWAQGLSAAQISARLFHTSAQRSAVLGKIHRLGLSNRTQRGDGMAKNARVRCKSKKHVWNSAASAAAQLSLTAQSLAEYQALRAKPDLDIPKHERKTILVEKNGRLHANDSLCSRSCRWAMTSDPPHEFCGRETVAPGISWCAFHLTRVANPPALAGRLIKAETTAWHAARDAKVSEQV